MQVETLPSGTRLFTGTSRSLRFASPCGESDRIFYKGPCSFANHPHAVAVPGYLGWLTVEPTSSQYRNHRLIIPEACWSREEVRALGGRPNIAVVVHIAEKLAAGSDFYIAANIGVHGAQSQGHAHWHIIVEPDLRKQVLTKRRLLRVYARPERLVFRTNAISVFVGGASPGQCVILPHDGLPHANVGSFMCAPTVDPVLLDLPVALERLVLLGAERLKSEDGVSPDYSVYLQFIREKFHSGCYTPAIKFPGAVEYASAALWKRQRIGMAWSHTEIAAFLRQS